MSDTEDLEVPISSSRTKDGNNNRENGDFGSTKKTEKKKRIMTPEALERLAKAREKAAEVKKKMKEAKKEKENQIIEKVKKEQMEILEKKVRNKMVDLSVDNEKESEDSSSPPLPKGTRNLMSARGALSPQDGNNNRENGDFGSEEPKKIKKKKPKKPVVIVEESSSDDDENVIYIKRKSSKPKNVPTIDPEQREPQKQFPAFGQMPRANLQNFNFNRQFM
jgi:hypothetical protein